MSDEKLDIRVIQDNDGIRWITPGLKVNSVFFEHYPHIYKQAFEGCRMRYVAFGHCKVKIAGTEFEFEDGDVIAAAPDTLRSLLMSKIDDAVVEGLVSSCVVPEWNPPSLPPFSGRSR